MCEYRVYVCVFSKEYDMAYQATVIFVATMRLLNRNGIIFS